MSLPLILGALWVIAASLTAMLPMRSQMLPGTTLLIAAPVLLIWIGTAHGWLWVVFGTFAFLSMFRRPLLHLTRRAMGLPSEIPAELRK
jgi:hypothetical protein